MNSENAKHDTYKLEAGGPHGGDWIMGGNLFLDQSLPVIGLETLLPLILVNPIGCRIGWRRGKPGAAGDPAVE